MERDGTGSNPVNDLHFKVLVLGESNVGKTSLMVRFVEGKYDEAYTSAIQMDYQEKSLSVDGKEARLRIFDTLGQERFRTITNSFYRSAFGVLLVFDVCNRNTFANLEKRWLHAIRTNASPHIIKIIVGNKTDRSEEERMVTTEEAKAWAESKGWKILKWFMSVKFLGLDYMETSAKENIGVDEAFTKLTRQMIEKREGPMDQSKEMSDSNRRIKRCQII